MKIDSGGAEGSPRPYGARDLLVGAIPGFRCAPPWAIFDSSLRDEDSQPAMTVKTRTCPVNENVHAIALVTPVGAGRLNSGCGSFEEAALNELVAQLVEQRPFKAWVVRSNRTELTTQAAEPLL